MSIENPSQHRSNGSQCVPPRDQRAASNLDLNEIDTAPPILVAGIGNIFLGDDGFGSAVAQRLLARDWPREVRVVDYGIRGIDLAYAMLGDCQSVILIDALPGDETPGTLRILEADMDQFASADTHATLLDAHSMHPLKVLQLVQTLGGELENVWIVGCQPKSLGGEDGHIGLSPPVEAAIDKAVDLVQDLVNQQYNKWLIRESGNESQQGAD